MPRRIAGASLLAACLAAAPALAQPAYPPGYAPPGYAPQAYPPQAYPPPGYAPQGYAPQGYAPPGYAPPGYAPQGYAPQGYAAPGAVAPGSPGFPPLSGPGSGARPGNVIGTGQSEPRSGNASNINGGDMRSPIAPSLPTPPPGDVQQLLLTARAAIVSGNTGEAQESLERAETAALQRSVPIGAQNVPDQSPLVGAINAALQALGRHDRQGAVAIIDQTVPHAAGVGAPH